MPPPPPRGVSHDVKPLRLFLHSTFPTSPSDVNDNTLFCGRFTLIPFLPLVPYFFFSIGEKYMADLAASHHSDSAQRPTRQRSPPSQSEGNIEVDVEGLYFPPPLNRDITNVVTVSNQCSEAFMFKLKASRPECYTARPHTGVINPKAKMRLLISWNPTVEFEHLGEEYTARPPTNELFFLECRGLPPGKVGDVGEMWAATSSANGGLSRRVFKLPCHFDARVPSSVTLVFGAHATHLPSATGGVLVPTGSAVATQRHPTGAAPRLLGPRGGNVTARREGDDDALAAAAGGPLAATPADTHPATREMVEGAIRHETDAGRAIDDLRRLASASKVDAARLVADVEQLQLRAAEINDSLRASSRGGYAPLGTTSASAPSNGGVSLAFAVGWILIAFLSGLIAQGMASPYIPASATEAV